MNVGRPTLGTKADALTFRDLPPGTNSGRVGSRDVEGSCLDDNSISRGVNSAELGLSCTDVEEEEPGVNSGADGLRGLLVVKLVVVPTVRFCMAAFNSLAVGERVSSAFFALPKTQRVDNRLLYRKI